MRNRWWPDLACALRDGGVRTERETTSTGEDGITTLPLMTGKEIDMGHGKVQYLVGGTLPGMHPTLITHIGKQVRVLRGHQLRSRFAPTVGIRNDGL